MYKSRELQYQLSDSGAKVFVSLDAFYPIVEPIKGETSVENIIVTNIGDFATAEDEIPTLFKVQKKNIPGTYQLLSLLEERADKLPEFEIDPSEDSAYLVYTAGTTGVSKGVMTTHKNLWANVHPIRYVFDVTEKDVNLQIMPMFHCSGYCLSQLSTLYAGGSVVLVSLFNAKHCLRWIEDYKVSIIFAPPTFYVGLLNEPEFKNYDLSTPVITSSCGGPQPTSVREEWEKIVGTNLLDGYGLTGTTLQHEDILRKYKMEELGEPIGKPHLPVEMRLVDDNGNDVPVEEVGEIAVRSPSVMLGYYKMEEKTNETFKGGWHHTGDLARMDEEGYYYFVDRKRIL